MFTDCLAKTGGAGMTEYIDREALHTAFDEFYFTQKKSLRETIDYVPAADVVPWDWLEKFAEGKRYNYLSDFLIGAKVVFYRELVKEVEQ